MGVLKSQVEALRPYLEGDKPGDDGEWGLHCPLHRDNTRSASMNVNTSEWWCQVCEVGGAVDQLMQQRSEWIDYSPGTSGSYDAPKELSEGDVGGYHSALMSEPTILEEFCDRRGLTVDTLVRYQIGFDREASAFTIPIRNAVGNLVNIRRYQLDPPEGRRKIWSVKGHGQPVLYPLEQLESDYIVICEGEWDALATIQAGIPAITRTAAAKTWDPKWSRLFSGKRVFLCHDRDNTGVVASKKVKALIQRYAKEVRIVKLPFPLTEKHGKDLSDFWMHYTVADFWALVEEAPPQTLNVTDSERDVSVSVMDTFDASMVGRTLSMTVDVSGKRLPGFLVPEKISYTCDMGAGAKCKTCPMSNDHAGHWETSIPRSDPLILKFLQVAEKTRNEELRIYCGAVKCGRLDIEVLEHATVEELYVRPASEERRDAERADYTNRRVLVVGRHDVQPNTTVDLIGTVLPSPKTSHNEFQAWAATVPPNALDTYELTSDGRVLCESFVPGPNQTPLAKVVDIARDLSAHVTRIVKRDELHVLFDLAWHSPLWFMWNGKVERGWLDVLVVGDTRTGKSEAATAMARHYRLGELVSCESASFAGIVGGLDKLDGENWVVTWGVVPGNDRGLVILDEVSGLATEQIAKMSSIRSSGIAELTKIRTERTNARTRLIWLGNPREAKMEDFAYGALAIAPLIGNNEDVARFDLAFSLTSGEVASEDINVQRGETAARYSAEAYQELVKWVWTRKPEQVVFNEGTIELIHELATELGASFVDTPPLIQAANVRFKLARISAALAGRTFSTNETGELLLVTPQHVEDAYMLINQIYESKGFGYSMLSAQRNRDIAATIENLEDSMNYVRQVKGLVRFLKDRPLFKTRDLEDFLSMDRLTAQTVLRDLYAMHVCHREGGLARAEGLVLRQLREITDDY